jgi:tetratricopeptide (TPR) repeat protein
MPRPSFIRALCLLAVVASLAGCASRSATGIGGEASKAAPAAKSASRTKTTKEAPVPKEISFEDRVEANARFAAGVAMELRGERDRALVEFYQAALADWANEALVSETARRLLVAKQMDKAVDVLTKCGARADATAPLLALLGYALRESGQTAKAIAANRNALRKTPDYLPAYQNLVQLHLSDKRPGEARKILDEAAQAVTNNAPDALLSLAETHNLFIRAHPDLAEPLKARVREILQKVVEQKPRPLFMEVRLAEGFFIIGDYGRAAAIYLEVLARDPRVPGLRERLIDAYVRNQDWKQAAEQLENLVRANPGNANAYLFLGGIAIEEKQPERAVEYLEKAILFKPELEEAYFELARLKLSLEKPAEALEVLARARQQFKPKFLLEFISGLAQSQAKKYPEALQHYAAAETLARESEPERLNHFFYFQRGAAHERNKDYELAEKHFKRCLEMAPDFAGALNYLGYMWAERGIKLPEARKFIERAVKLEPDNDAYLDSMAWVLYKLGDYPAALEWQLKALKHNEKPDATLYDHLGDIYAALQRVDDARKAWQKALEIEPSDEVRKKLSPPAAAQPQ